MNTIYFSLVLLNITAFTVGNYFKWKKTLIQGKTVTDISQTEYNSKTLLATIIIFSTLIAIVFTADNLLIGVLTSILLFVLIDPLLAAIILNIVRAAKSKGSKLEVNAERAKNTGTETDQPS